MLSFVRAKNGDKVFALFNLSGETQTVSFTDGPSDGSYIDFADGSPVDDHARRPASSWRPGAIASWRRAALTGGDATAQHRAMHNA